MDGNVPFDYLTYFNNCPTGGGGGGNTGGSTGSNNPSPVNIDYMITTPVPDRPKWGVCSERTGANWNPLPLNSNQLAFVNDYSHRALRGELTNFFANNDVFIFDCNSPRNVAPEVQNVGMWIVNMAINDTDFLNSEFWADFISADLSVQQASINYITQNNLSWSQADALIFSVINFVRENPNVVDLPNIFQRIINLNSAVAQDPDLLLDISCQQLSQLDDWQQLANHQVPQYVKNKIQNIKNQTSYYDNWLITDLDDGLGPRLNMDLFPVKITEMPNKPNGQKYTSSEFFDFFRKNINLFAEQFTPIVDNDYGINDAALWSSNNPLGALIHIDIDIIPSVLSDDGTVVCSGMSSNTWIFSTIKAPLDWYHDGIHPVAGNRAFSYYTNPVDGSITIYTRGVDRVSKNYSDDGAIINHLIESGAFVGADNLWTGMQDELSKFIDDNGGKASKVAAITYRPKYQKIKDYISGKIPISSLNCN